MKSHWEQVYGTRVPDAATWYAPHLQESLEYIRKTGVPIRGVPMPLRAPFQSANELAPSDYSVEAVRKPAKMSARCGMKKLR